MMYRSKKLLEAVRDAPCMHCGAQDGTVVYDMYQHKELIHDRGKIWIVDCSFSGRY